MVIKKMKVLFIILITAFLFSCSSNKKAHIIANAVIKYDKRNYSNNEKAILFFYGIGLTEKFFYDEIISYKNKFESKDIQKTDMIYFERGYEWLVSDKQIDSVLKKIKSKSDIVYWKSKKINAKDNLIISNKKTYSSDNVLDEVIINYYISKPVFVNKNICFVFLITGIGFKTDSSKLLILAKDKIDWKVVSVSYSYVH